MRVEVMKSHLEKWVTNYIRSQEDERNLIIRGEHSDDDDDVF